MYFPALTSLRGLAALIVLQFHFLPFYLWGTGISNAQILPLGYAGVDLFFILSGFVLLVQYDQRDGDVRYFPYLLERSSRIFPLHLVTLIAIIAAKAAFDIFSEEETVLSAIAAGLLIHSWGLYETEVFNVPSWSLSIEWALYLTCIPVFLVISKLKNPLIIFGLIVLILLAEFGAAKFVLGYDTLNMRTDYGVIRGYAGFVVGCLLYRAWCECKEYKFRWPILESIAIGLVLVDSLFWQASWLINLSFPVFVFAALFPGTWTHRALSRKSLEWLGLISYSIYMWHWLFRILLEESNKLFPWVEGNVSIQIILNILFIGVTILTAKFSYTLIEKPGRNFVRKFVTPRIS